MSFTDRLLKRSFDFCAAFFGLFFLWPIILATYLIATIDTRQNGFFRQVRIGRNAKPFKVVKIRSMRKLEHVDTTVTTDHDPRITAWGRFFRKTKLDELPQLWNVLLGEMSFVGPRPDVPGYADKLEGDDRLILSVRPGITSPGTLAFRDEERILAEVEDPERYNREVIYPEKVRLNLAYIRDYHFTKDIGCILQTLFGR